jgi:ribonuclease H2 subunit C
MLSLQPSSSKTPPKFTPNILPCSIKHSGPIPIAPRHWNPTPSTPPPNPPDSNASRAPQIVHFRGRKLQGRTIQLPVGYTGVVARKTERVVLPEVRGRGREDEDEEVDEDVDEERSGEMLVETKVMEMVGTFEEVCVWGHEKVPEGEDVYVKGIEEWIGFAEKVSSEGPPIFFLV